MRQFTKQTVGFTLIELVVVIGIIGVLAAVVWVAINPAQQYAAARDAQRRADIHTIVNALNTYADENNGNFPEEISTDPTQVGMAVGLVDLTQELVPTFISVIPADPVLGTQANTHYSVYLDENNRIVATASSELNRGAVIQVVR